MRYLFNKKSKVFYYQSKKEKFSEYLDGYTVDIKAFPFGICKREKYGSEYWIIVNRFSGVGFPNRFAKKESAEDYFDIFAEEHNVLGIDFKDPKNDFDYYLEGKKILSSYIRRKNGVKK